MNLTKMIECLQIAAKYCNPDKDYYCAEHDILFLPLMGGTQLDNADRARLTELGAFMSTETDSWAVFT